MIDLNSYQNSINLDFNGLVPNMFSKQSTIRHWENYWKKHQDMDHVYSNEDRIYLNLCRVTEISGKKILEVGAGSGRDSFQLVDGKGIVFVLDYSPQALSIIKNLNQKVGAQLHLIQGDALKIPLPDASMDIVFHQGLMEHFKDPMPLLREHFRVLKPGGYLLVDVPQRYHIYTLIKHVLILFNKWFAGWETEFSIGQLKRIIETSGFVIRHQYGRWMQPSLFYRMVREVLKPMNIRLPLYPGGFRYTRALRNWLRSRLQAQGWTFYTYVDIGVIGQKSIQ